MLKRFLKWSGLLSLVLSVLLTGCAENTQAEKALAKAQLDTGNEIVENQTEASVKDIVQTTTVSSGKKLKVSFIDVGQADSILIQVDGKNALIDAGNGDDFSTISSYLKDQGVTHLDDFVLTHIHEDHIGSASQILESLSVSQVIMPKQMATTQVFRNFMTTLTQKNIKPIEAKAGVKLDLGTEAYAEFLAPNSSTYEDANDYSAVLRLVYGKNVFLFTGDAQAFSQDQMMNLGYDLKADVLKVPHHGSSSSDTAFFKKVSPKYSVISVGKGNNYGHPASSTVNALINLGSTIYRTDEQGTVVAESDGTNIIFQALGTKNQPRAPTPSVSPSNGSVSSSSGTVIVPPAPKTNNSDITVYVTKTGSKYHRDGCRYLAKSKIPISLSQARQGYGACSVCNPPQ